MPVPLSLCVGKDSFNTLLTVQILTVIDTVKIDIMNASAERTDISTVVLNLDDEFMADFSVGKHLLKSRIVIVQAL